MKNIIGIDTQFVYHSLRARNVDFKFPYLQIRELIEGEGDEVIDMFGPVVRFPPASAADEDFRRSFENYQKVSTALMHQGLNVIEAPAKPAGDGVKHSDDQRLMIKLALVCARLKPDFLVLVAGDGDYAPLVWGLRDEGIRTKLITDLTSVAPELKAAVYSVSDIFNVLQQVT